MNGKNRVQKNHRKIVDFSEKIRYFGDLSERADHAYGSACGGEKSSIYRR